MKPNFFLIGAPKCGTTSLAHWLSQHPQIFMATPKEPRYFNSDFELPFRPQSLAEYEALYINANGRLAVGEATTGYLCSEVAVHRILEYAPDARFVVCLRPPVDLLCSLHRQRLKESVENLRTLEAAWAAQSDRLHGRGVPVICPDPKLLHYDRFCRIGAQLERLLESVSREHLHVVLLEDMKVEPGAIYDALCDFLGVHRYVLPEFSHDNASSVPRSLRIAQFLRAAGLLRRKWGLPPFGFASRLNKINLVSSKESRVSPLFIRRLRMHFDEDIRLLESKIKRDLSHWRHGSNLQ